MKTKRLLQGAFLLLLIAGAAVAAWQTHNAPYRHYQGRIFGTTFNITYQSSDNLEQDIIAALNGVDASLSMFNAKSTLARINRGETTTADNHLLYLLPKALQVGEATEGAFDVTVAPLVNAWGFGFKHEQWPTDAVIDSLLQLVDYRSVSIEDRTIVRRNPNTTIDLSAIAKGYGTDIVARTLDKAKVKNYMVEIGGEVVVKGVNDKGETWRIGIQNPQRNNTTAGYMKVLQLTDCAIATSGNYRNFFVRDGVTYSHTIDPRTGRPVQRDIISATVIAPECHAADAYATAFMVVGLEKAKQILAKQKHLRAYLIYIDKNGETKHWDNTYIKDN